MKIYEIATGFTSIPARIGAATEIVVENLVNAFSTNNEVTLIDLKNPERKTGEYPVIEINLPSWATQPASFLSWRHRAKRVLYSFKLALKIKKLLKTETKAVFHFHNQYNFYFSYRWCFFFKPKSNDIKLAYTLHTPLWSEDIETINRTAKKRYFMEIFAMKHADIVICLNPKIKKNLEEFFHGKINSKLGIIPNGVDNNTYHPARKEIAEDKGLNFVNIGSVCDRKNQLKTIRLLKPILENNDSHFYYAGAIADEQYMQDIEEYVEENNLADKVIYLGEISPGKSLNQEYNNADIYISHSKSEAFSLTILEAMSAGLPVLVSKSFETSINGMPPTSALTMCSSDEDFYNQINILLKDRPLLENLKEESVNYIQENFTWEQIAKEHENVFNANM